MQDIYNKQTAIQGGMTDIAGNLTGRLGAEYGEAIDWSGLSPLAGTPVSQFTLPEGSIGDPNAFRQQGEDASYNAAMSRITPQYEEQKRAMEVQLRNQGLGPEDAAWQSQMEGIATAETDATSQAIWDSQEAGRAESNLNYGQQYGIAEQDFGQALASNAQNYGQSMEGANYANQLRQQQMTEEMTMRGYGLNEINALLSGGQVGVPTMPSFAAAGAAEPAPTYQAGVDQGNFDQGSSLWGGVSNIAASFAGNMN